MQPAGQPSRSSTPIAWKNSATSLRSGAPPEMNKRRRPPTCGCGRSRRGLPRGRCHRLRLPGAARRQLRLPRDGVRRRPLALDRDRRRRPPAVAPRRWPRLRHQHGITHRDVKPDIANCGTAKLLDFGVARLSSIGSVIRSWSRPRSPPRRRRCSARRPGPSSSPSDRQRRRPTTPRSRCAVVLIDAGHKTRPD